jgi:ABC-type multidrug transport system fused ATPase/permease subunit
VAVSGQTLTDGLRLLGRGVREEPRVFALAAGGGAAFGLLSVASAYVVGAVVGHMVVPALDAGHVAAGALALGGGAILGLSLLKICSILGRRLGAGLLQFRLQGTFRRRVTRRYLELPLAWHRRHATGTLLSNANSDVEAASMPFATAPFAVGTLVMMVGALGSLLWVDWTFALVGAAVFPTLFCLNYFYSRFMSPRIARAQVLRAELSALAHESFDGALLVKTMGRAAVETERFATRARELRDAMVRVGRIRGMFDPLLDALPSLASLAVLLVGVVRLREGAVSVTDVVSVSFLFTVLAFPLRAIGWVLTDLPRSVVGYDRVAQVVEASGEMVYGTSEFEPSELASTELGRSELAPAEFSQSESAALPPAALSLRGVSFAYDAQEVLHDISFDVGAGRTVALVGPTGSGKSTIASVVARLMDPSAGTIRIDGVDARDLSTQALVRTVALVAQIPFVFDDSVAGNVSLDRPGVDEAAQWEALRLAQADGFVSRLPDGVRTVVGERGTTLSGGQRQRLTLARAFAGRPRLLVLDDATSAVDPAVEARILAGLRTDASASVLVVAHRRATIALADEVVYLERGRLVAFGPHDTLLATVPAYAELVTAYEQAADAEPTQVDDSAWADDPDDAEPGRADNSGGVNDRAPVNDPARDDPGQTEPVTEGAVDSVSEDAGVAA